MHQQDEQSKEIINRILHDYIDKIFAFALKRTMNRQDAEDLSQDIVFEVLRSSSSLKDSNAFNGWLWSIAKNTWRRWIYKRTSHPIESYDDLNMVLFDENANLDDIVIFNEDINLLRREIALLSQIQRNITVLYYIEEKNYEEISDALKISKGMVKQHLFKVRKILKEGVNVVRELGEKSYNPKDFVFGFWGESGSIYFKMFERKLPKNIVMSAYQKPITIEEMSVDIGVPRPYLEDELKILLDGDVITQNKDEKYQTNFIIILRDLQEKIDNVLADMCQSFTSKLLESFNKNENVIRKLGFIGSDFKWERLLWTFIPFSMFLAFNKLQSETFHEPPLLKTGIRGWANARERKPEEWDFGVHFHNNLESGLGYWSCNFNISPKNTSGIFGPNVNELGLLKTLYDGRRDLSTFSENELEIIATLIEQGFIKKETQKCIPNFIGLDSHSFTELINLENSDRAFVYEELKQTLPRIVNILDTGVPNHLREQTEIHAFMSLIIFISDVMRYLNNQGILNIPPKNEINTTTFFMFKDCIGLNLTK